MEQLIEDERGRKLLMNRLQVQQLPFRIVVKDGRARSVDQNRLLWKWVGEAAAHRGDVTPQEVAAEWKLEFGTPLLCAENEEFAAMWAIAEKKLDYEELLQLVRIVNVTSLMSMGQLKRYLDQVYQWNVERGVELTDPERQRDP